MTLHLLHLLAPVLAVLFAALAMTHTSLASEQATLWQIGLADGDDREFALGPGGWPRFEERFELDPVFLVGRSSPREDWPYIHPGPSDSWAGSRSHTFTILFALREVPEGVSELIFDLVGTHVGLPPRIQVAVNDASYDFTMPPGRALEAADDPARGTPFQFICVMEPGALKTGLNRVTITTLSGAWIVYDAIRFVAPAGTALEAVALAPTDRTVIQWMRPLEALVRGEDGNARGLVAIGYRHVGDPVEAVVRIGDLPAQRVRLSPREQSLEIPIPAVERAGSVSATVEVGGQVVATRRLELRPVRPWVIELMHHTHLDIGYTHSQEDVERLQWEHLERALEIAGKNDRPGDPARFIWLPEGTWAMDGYLRQADSRQKERFIEAVRGGTVELSALYGNALTGLYHPEELLELVGFARRFAREYEVTIDAAMLSDVPGVTWGLVPALAQSGVKYLSMGPNSGHRIGHTFVWADRPFYWESPSGQERVLCWVHGKGYSWFHTGLQAALTGEVGATRLTDKRLLGYLEELAEKEYPYDVVPVRYNIGSDNGPPDPNLPEIVRQWNERYLAPRLAISTPSAVFKAFEERHGSELPVVRGDFTPYWEDGAASTARETAINRRAADRLVQASALWAMRKPGAYPAARFQDAWRELILYDEHTWGAWNSISDPDNPFVDEQWMWKRQRALLAESLSTELLTDAMGRDAEVPSIADAVEVFNTTSWPRSDLVVIPAGQAVAGDVVRDANGKPVPSQRLADGGLAFVAKDVPAFSSARYTLHAGEPATYSGGGGGGWGAEADATGVRNEHVEAMIDPHTGHIVEFCAVGRDVNLVDGSAPYAMNEYAYVAGRSPDSPQRVKGPVKVTVINAGPVVATLRIESDAPGCETLVRELEVVRGLDHLRLRDTLDRKTVREPEGVHIAFPFNVPEGKVRVNGPWSVVRAEKDQLDGACRNWFTVDRWVDIANDDHGVTWVTLDAPMMELGGILADPIVVGWLTKLEPSQTIYSYVMNNYWETNYKADQPGVTKFEYALRPHGGYDGAAASRFAQERSRPLIAVATRDGGASTPSLVKVSNPDAIVTMLKPSDGDHAVIVRLFNPQEKPITTDLLWGGGAAGIYGSNLFEDRLGPVEGTITLRPFEVRTVRIEPEGSR